MTDEPNFEELEADPRSHPRDIAVLRTAATGEGAIPITSMEMFQKLAEAAKATKDHFDAEYADMTQEQADFVRSFRVDKGYSWRAVAAAYDEKYGTDTDGNQLSGMALCERAADMHGEEYMSDPWN